ncbi:MAG: S8 family serine peptidase [Candidatus Baltobacteraceae bacterium]
MRHQPGSGSFQRFALAVLAAVFTFGTAAPLWAQPAKKAVASEADLPRFTYPLQGSASQLLQADPATFDAFAARVGADVDRTLAEYDVADHATLADLLQTKLAVFALAGKTHEALALIPQIRSLQDKPDAKLVADLSVETALEASLQTKQTSGPAFEAAFKTLYERSVAPLPYAVVGNTLKSAKAGVEIFTPALAIGQVQANLDPAVAKDHSLSGEFARALLGARLRIELLYPAKAPSLAVLDAYLARNSAATKPDIFAERDVPLDGKPNLTPVPIAIWDGGTDISLFPQQLWDAPPPQGADPHDIAFDLLGFPTHGPLFPLTPAQQRAYPQMIDDIKAFSDLQANVDSPEASALRQRLTALKPAEVGTYLESLDLYGQYVHGTHVAGIAVRGNPAARIVVGRLTYDYKLIPTPPTDEIVRRSDEDDQKFVDYFKALGVRVVNMSWGGTPADYENALEKNGLGKDAAGRKAAAQRWFALDKAALTKAIASAPQILFVCAAGNSNANASFEDDIPASLDLPNLLVVGAVDQAGDETSFTSYGPTVRVDADGYEVVSAFPGGRRVPLSGTSMASPNAANLAAKLIALDPKLTPEQTIALIEKGATTTADGRRHLIDPKRSVELLLQTAAKP